MANKSQGSWYVSFELPRGKRTHARATETFRSELEAKNLREQNWPKLKMSAPARSILICRNGRSPKRRYSNGSKYRMKADLA